MACGQLRVTNMPLRGRVRTVAEPNGELLTIGRMAHLAGVSERALRIYQARGVLSPARVDPFTGYRYYDPAQLADLRHIRELRALGFSLAEIADALSDQNPASLRDRISAHLADLACERRRIDRACELGEALLHECDEQMVKATA